MGMVEWIGVLAVAGFIAWLAYRIGESRRSSANTWRMGPDHDYAWDRRNKMVSWWRDPTNNKLIVWQDEETGHYFRAPEDASELRENLSQKRR